MSKAFEDWAHGAPVKVNLTKTPAGAYAFASGRAAFAAWCEGRRTVAAEAREKVAHMEAALSEIADSDPRGSIGSVARLIARRGLGLGGNS